MRHTRDWQLTCLALGEVAPLVPAGLTRLSGAVWSARTLDAFLTELDAGGALPDAVLAFGGDGLIRALRSHDRTCSLPVYLFAAADQPAAPGWDGCWPDESAVALDALAERAAWTAALPALDAPLDSLRREHRFARWLAARGHCQPADAEVFGLDAPRSTLSAWQERAWVSAPAGADADWQASDALRAAAGGPALIVAAAPAEPAALETPAAPAASQSPEPLEAPSAMPGPEPAPAAATQPPLPPDSRRPLPRSLLLALSAFLIVLAALIWSGGLDLLRPALGGAETRTHRPNLQIGGSWPSSASAPRGPVLPEATRPGDGPPAAPPAAAPAAPPAAAPVRTVARGAVWREASSLRALSAGRVAALLAAPGAWLPGGGPLARLVDPRAERDVTRLEQELGQVDAAIEAGGHDDAQARTLARTQGELEEQRLTGELAGAVARTAQAQDLYAKSLRLAEEGVISFREVRPDWNALQQARDAEAQARGMLSAFLTGRGQPPGSAQGEAPAWLVLRRARLEDELRTARSMAAPRMVRAAEAGELLAWRVAVGDDVEEGSELAQIASGEAWVEARLNSGERGPAGKIGEVELRLGADGPWIAVTDFQEVVSPGMGALLRARVPLEHQAAARSGAAAELRFLSLD